MILVERL